MVSTKGPHVSSACMGRNRESTPAYATKQDAQKYLVKRVCNLKGFEVVTENEGVRRNIKDVIVDVYARDLYHHRRIQRPGDSVDSSERRMA
jgi:hypothetical protein